MRLSAVVSLADPRGQEAMGQRAMPPQTADEIFCFAKSTDFRTNSSTLQVVQMQKAFSLQGSWPPDQRLSAPGPHIIAYVSAVPGG